MVSQTFPKLVCKCIASQRCFWSSSIYKFVYVGDVDRWYQASGLPVRYMYVFCWYVKRHKKCRKALLEVATEVRDI